MQTERKPELACEMLREGSTTTIVDHWHHAVLLTASKTLLAGYVSKTRRGYFPERLKVAPDPRVEA